MALNPELEDTQEFPVITHDQIDHGLYAQYIAIAGTEEIALTADKYRASYTATGDPIARKKATIFYEGALSKDFDSAIDRARVLIAYAYLQLNGSNHDEKDYANARSYLSEAGHIIPEDYSRKYPFKDVLAIYKDLEQANDLYRFRQQQLSIANSWVEIDTQRAMIRYAATQIPNPTLSTNGTNGKSKSVDLPTIGEHGWGALGADTDVRIGGTAMNGTIYGWPEASPN